MSLHPGRRQAADSRVPVCLELAPDVGSFSVAQCKNPRAAKTAPVRSIGRSNLPANKPRIMDHNAADVNKSLDCDTLYVKYFKPADATDYSANTSDKMDLLATYVEKRWDEFKQVEDPNRKVPEQHVSGLDLPAPATHLRSKSSRPKLSLQ